MSDIETVQQRADRIVRQEVHCCLSSLVLMLDAASDASIDPRYETAGLIDKAADLAAPVLDYESAAREAGWEPYVDKFNVASWSDPSDNATFAGTAQSLCEFHDIEPHDREVHEHWAVSEWLADKLEAHGEKVDRDFASLIVWARTATGQAISIDGVIERIAAELPKA